MAAAVESRIRVTLQASIFLITLAAWWVTYSQVRHMGLLMSLGVPMSLGMEGWADLTSFSIFSAMWVVMMVAMMLPSSYPTLLVHRTLYRKRNPQQPGGTLLFAVSYFTVWAASGILFYFAYVLIGQWRSGVVVSDTAIIRASGIGLIIAGAYQWSQFKTMCLKHCQSPLGFVAHHWRDGRLGALQMGVQHAFYCFGCCWGLMLVLFIMGVMHLAWMAAISVFILAEKMTPSALWLPKLLGIVLVALGALVFVLPATLLSLSSQVLLR